jgi:uncharacterized membrane protein
MAVYAVFEPPAGGERLAHAEKIAFVRDGFSWGAFIFGPLWLLWRRLWLPFVVYIVVVGVLSVAVAYLRVGESAGALLALLVALLLGLEGPALRRGGYLRRGWRERGIVVGKGLPEAERRFFDQWVNSAASSQLPFGQPSRAMSTLASDIIGLFPEPGGKT